MDVLPSSLRAGPGRRPQRPGRRAVVDEPPLELLLGVTTQLRALRGGSRRLQPVAQARGRAISHHTPSQPLPEASSTSTGVEAQLAGEHLRHDAEAKHA